MLPPNIAHLAAKAKAADSLGLRYTDVTVTALEGAVTEATVLVDEHDVARAEVDELLGKLADNTLLVQRTQARVIARLLRQLIIRLGGREHLNHLLIPLPSWLTDPEADDATVIVDAPATASAEA